MGCRFLLQGIFLTQGSNPHLLHCRQILYHLNQEVAARCGVTTDVGASAMEYRLLLKQGNGRRENRIDSESKVIQSFLGHRKRAQTERLENVVGCKGLTANQLNKKISFKIGVHLHTSSSFFKAFYFKAFLHWSGTPLQYFAWKIPWMEEPGRLQSMGSLRVGHD